MAPIVKAAKTLKRHLPYFLTSCTHRITTATSEGINNKIQTIRQMAFGYRSQEHYKTAISFHSCGLDMYWRSEAV